MNMPQMQAAPGANQRRPSILPGQDNLEQAKQEIASQPEQQGPAMEIPEPASAENNISPPNPPDQGGLSQENDMPEFDMPPIQGNQGDPDQTQNMPPPPPSSGGNMPGMMPPNMPSGDSDNQQDMGDMPDFGEPNQNQQQLPNDESSFSAPPPPDGLREQMLVDDKGPISTNTAPPPFDAGQGQQQRPSGPPPPPGNAPPNQNQGDVPVFQPPGSENDEDQK
jgi:hypothetical protein